MPRLARLAAATGLVLFVATLPAAAGPLGDFAQQAYEATRRANAGSALGEADIDRALREALAKGAGSAVRQLGQPDGYWQNPQFRIPLPGKLVEADALLRGFGAGPRLDELHLSMNRAAESAVPVAADVFSGAIGQMSLSDARAILDGAPDAATQYFRKASSDTLLARFRPIVADITARAGLARQYKAVLAGAGPLATTLGVPDLDDYVARKALDGLFLRVAEEERAIRENPAARTTALMKKVFAR